MSQAKPTHTMSIASFDAATLALAHAIAMLHCVHAASDPANLNIVSPSLLSDALDGVTDIVTAARDHLVPRTGCGRPTIVVDFRSEQR